MVQTLESSIYDKVYNILKEKHCERIRYIEFYDILANLRLKTNGLSSEIESQLLDLGLLEKDVREIVKKIKYYRLTLYDAGIIEKRMKEKGMILYKPPGWIIILKQGDVVGKEDKDCLQDKKTDARLPGSSF